MRMFASRFCLSLFLFVAAAACCAAEECPDLPESSKGITDETGTPLHLVQPPKLIVTPFDDGLYWAADGIYQNMFMVGDSGVIVVDAPPNFFQTTPNLVEAIAGVTDKPITHLVYSHFHRDHIGAANEVAKAFPDVKIVANEKTKELIQAAQRRNQDDPRPLPTVTFEQDALLAKDGTLREGGYPRDGKGRAKLAEFTGLTLTSGKFHGDGDLFIMAPAQRVMYVVDLIFPGFSPFSRLAITRDVGEFLDAHDTLLDFDFDTLVAGHLTRLGTKEDIRTQKAYMESIVAGARKGLAEAQFGPDNSEPCYLADPFNAVLDYLDRVLDICTKEVVAEWKGKLGAVETFTRAHCDTIQTYLRVD
ncbi:hypothetical protein BSKO_06235 [Bryopsis sp. KO-2023]|nr:hypothetical protein BSKO_06235 [Bryopsis sp. KO-2023]